METDHHHPRIKAFAEYCLNTLRKCILDYTKLNFTHIVLPVVVNTVISSFYPFGYQCTRHNISLFPLKKMFSFSVSILYILWLFCTCYLHGNWFSASEFETILWWEQNWKHRKIILIWFLLYLQPSVVNSNLVFLHLILSW